MVEPYNNVVTDQDTRAHVMKPDRFHVAAPQGSKNEKTPITVALVVKHEPPGRALGRRRPAGRRVTSDWLAL